MSCWLLNRAFIRDSRIGWFVSGASQVLDSLISLTKVNQSLWTNLTLLGYRLLYKSGNTGLDGMLDPGKLHCFVRENGNQA